MFKFKYYNNILGINSRVAHFNPEVDAGCTFCKITGPHPVPAESFVHLFYECPSVNSLLVMLNNNYFGLPNLTKEQYFLSTFGNSEQNNIVGNIFLDVFRYLIWQKKLEKQIPREHVITADLNYNLSVIIRTIKKLENMFNNCTFAQDGGGNGGHGNGRRP
jgi:hypothetical protein